MPQIDPRQGACGGVGLAKSTKNQEPTSNNYFQRDFDKLGIDIEVELLSTVEGKAAAHELEARYINTFRRIFGKRPPYNRSNH
jgi:hypothetical protein